MPQVLLNCLLRFLIEMKVKLVAKQKIFSEVYNFVLSTDIPIVWEAGQYMRYQLTHSSPDDRGESRFFTISSAPFEKNLHLTTRINSSSSTFKQKLLSLEPGDTFDAFGPNGKFTVPRLEKPVVFIAGGIGITPFRSIIANLDHQNLAIPITLLYANKTNEIIFQAELEKIAQKHPEFTIHYFIDNNKLDQAALQQFTSNSNPSIFYISGPEGLMKSLFEMLQNSGISEDNIKHDFFPGYDD